MNVMVYNKYKAQLLGLNLEIMKSLEGVYNVDEIIDTFSGIFYEKMILDITAIRDYQNIDNLQKLAMNIRMDNVVLLLDDNEIVNSSEFISKLISLGIYNFTKNVDGVNYLLANPHTYEQVQNLHTGGFVKDTMADIPTMEVDTPNTLGGIYPATTTTMQNNMRPVGNNNPQPMPAPVYEQQKQEPNNLPINNGKIRIIGFKDVTLHAGATSLIYMIKKALQGKRRISAIEINKVDFLYYNDRDMVSVISYDVPQELIKRSNDDIIFVDLNDYEDTSICTEVYYLVEPSTLMINRMVKRNKGILEKLRNEKVIVTKCALSKSDLSTFEYETKLKIFMTLPYLNDRDESISLIHELIKRMKL